MIQEQSREESKDVQRIRVRREEELNRVEERVKKCRAYE
jgi:hypothetical protein